MRYLKMLGAAIVVALGLTLVVALPVAALTPVAAVSEQPAVIFTIQPVLLIGTLLTFVFPVVVGWISNSTWSSRAKGLAHAALSAVGGLLAELADALGTGTTYDIGVGLLTAVGIFVGGVAAYRAIYAAKPSEGESLADRWANSGGIYLKKH